MSWKFVDSHSLRFRLNLLVTCLFILSFLMVFMSVDRTLQQVLMDRKDAELQDDSAEFETHDQSLGRNALMAELQKEIASSEPDKDLFAVVGPSHDIRLLAGPKPDRQLLLQAANAAQKADATIIRTIPLLNGEGIRVIANPLADGSVLILGLTTEDIEEIMESYRNVFSGTAILLLLGSLFMGWLVARRSVTGILRVAEAARQIEQGHFDHRVPPCREGTELTNLSESFNAMAERVQRLLTELESVSGNVAHDLKSPLTRIRGLAEQALTTDANTHAWAGPVVEECDRMINMIETMLEIARMNAGMSDPEWQEVNWTRLLKEAIDVFSSVAEDAGVHLQVSLTKQPIKTEGNARRLQRMVANLLDNAIKFTPAGGTVQLALARSGEHVVLTIRDTGIGIPDEELPHIFNRFYRGEQSRTTPGSGLGLSLAQAIASSHGGGITVSSQAGKGTTFTVQLPLTPPHVPTV